MPVHVLGPGVSRYRFQPRLDAWVKSRAAAFDAVIVNGVWRYLGQGIRNGLRRLGVPYFIIPHSMLNPWFQETTSFSSLSKIAMWRLLEWKVLRDARAVLFTCEEERRMARKAYSPYVCTDDVVTVVGTSIPVACSQQTEFVSCYPHLRDKRLIIYLSRLHPMKGCDLLLEAFSRICKAHPDLHLVIAGPAEEGFVAMLHALTKRRSIEHRVTWTGPLYGEMKWAAFRAAALFALPSHCEAFPVAVLEALGARVPALITDKVNIWRDVVSENAGFVDTDTIEGTVRSLQKWLGMSEAELQVMRNNAHKCFTEHFEATSNALQFLRGLQRHGVCA